MAKKQKIKKLKEEKELLVSRLNESIERLYAAAEDLTGAADTISYMSGQIAAYRDVLSLKD